MPPENGLSATLFIEVTDETKIKSIEWLFLAAKGHRRAKFEYENKTIKKSWLTP